MPLPYTLTDVPNADREILNRLAAEGNQDVQWLLGWVAQEISDLQEEIDRLYEALDLQDDEPRQGAQVGRPPFGNAAGEMDVVQTILEMNEQKKSLRSIARYLNEKGYKSASGKKWHQQTVKNVINRHREICETKKLSGVESSRHE